MHFVLGLVKRQSMWFMSEPNYQKKNKYFKVSNCSSFHTAIFGIIPPDCSATSPQSNAVAFASLLARRLILLNWKSKTAPYVSQWSKDVLSFLPLEKLRYKVRNANKNFILAWSPFIDFVGECPFK